MTERTKGNKSKEEGTRNREVIDEIEPVVSVYGTYGEDPRLFFQSGNTYVKIVPDSFAFEHGEKKRRKNLDLPVKYFSQILEILENVGRANKEHGLETFIAGSGWRNCTRFIYNAGRFQVEQSIFVSDVNAKLSDKPDLREILETFCKTFEKYGEFHDVRSLGMDVTIVPIKDKEGLASRFKSLPRDYEVLGEGLMSILKGAENTDKDWILNVAYSDTELESEKPRPKISIYETFSPVLM